MTRPIATLRITAKARKAAPRGNLPTALRSRSTIAASAATAPSAAGASTQSELILTGCTFDGSDKTNIYRERCAIVQTDGVADNSARPEPSSGDGSSRKKSTRSPTDDDIYRMIRRFHP